MASNSRPNPPQSPRDGHRRTVGAPDPPPRGRCDLRDRRVAQAAGRPQRSVQAPTPPPLAPPGPGSSGCPVGGAHRSPWGVTQLPRYYGPLRHPIQATPSLTRPWLSEHATHPPDGVSRVASISPVHACHRHYPGGTAGCLCRSTRPATAAFPEFPTGRRPHQSFLGLLSVHCALRPACSPSPLQDTLHWKLQSLRYLHDCSNCCRLKRQLPGGNRTH